MAKNQTARDQLLLEFPKLRNMDKLMFKHQDNIIYYFFAHLKKKRFWSCVALEDINNSVNTRSGQSNSLEK